VVIPKSVREHLDLSVGEKLEVIVHEGRIELIRRVPIHEMRGFLREERP
jgi:AbrB family looped-hinge helix DNA binding protein